MSTIANGKYEVKEHVFRKEDSMLIVTLENGVRLMIEAPHFYEDDYEECTHVTVQDNKASTPIIVHTPISYKTSCSYSVV